MNLNFFASFTMYNAYKEKMLLVLLLFFPQNRVTILIDNTLVNFSKIKIEKIAFLIPQ